VSIDAQNPDYCGFLRRITPENLNEMARHIAPNVHFKDPFNDVNTLADMQAIYADMFEQVSDFTFDIHEQLSDGPVTVITWTLDGTLMGKPWAIDGASRLTFNEAGLLIEHVDFWDAAGGLYERFPVIGWLLGVIRRKLSVAETP
tara:strand:- start:1236 stop:1670 length:435 start_codon:yes stop_codon:yes gene_type:complete